MVQPGLQRLSVQFLPFSQLSLRVQVHGQIRHGCQRALVLRPQDACFLVEDLLEEFLGLRILALGMQIGGKVAQRFQRLRVVGAEFVPQGFEGLLLELLSLGVLP